MEQQAYLASQGEQMLRSAAPETSVSDVIPQIPVADDPFQKLLEAAWVLQQSNDQKPSHQLPFDFTTRRCAGATDAAERATLQAKQAADVFQPLGNAWPVSQPPTLLGSVTLSTDSFSEYGLEPPETDPQPEPILPITDAQEIERPNVVAERHVRLPLRLRLNAPQARMLGFCAALVLAAMMYAILRTRAGDQASAAVASPPAAASVPELASAKAKLPGPTQTSIKSSTARTNSPISMASLPSMTKQSRPAIGEVPAAGLTSHKTVTDSSTRYALESMSRYEIQSLRRQAKYGDDSAAMILGMAYETGHYVRQNCKTAAEWVERAAKDGNPAAQYNLGLRYQVGDGVPVDHNLASTWMGKSALRKYAQAQSFLSSTSQR